MSECEVDARAVHFADLCLEESQTVFDIAVRRAGGADPSPFGERGTESYRSIFEVNTDRVYPVEREKVKTYTSDAIKKQSDGSTRQGFMAPIHTGTINGDQNIYMIDGWHRWAAQVLIAYQERLVPIKRVSESGTGVPDIYSEDAGGNIEWHVPEYVDFTSFVLHSFTDLRDNFQIGSIPDVEMRTLFHENLDSEQFWLLRKTALLSADHSEVRPVRLAFFADDYWVTTAWYREHDIGFKEALVLAKDVRDGKLVEDQGVLAKQYKYQAGNDLYGKLSGVNVALETVQKYFLLSEALPPEIFLRLRIKKNGTPMRQGELYEKEARHLVDFGKMISESDERIAWQEAISDVLTMGWVPMEGSQAYPHANFSHTLVELVPIIPLFPQSDQTEKRRMVYDIAALSKKFGTEASSEYIKYAISEFQKIWKGHEKTKAGQQAAKMIFAILRRTVSQEKEKWDKVNLSRLITRVNGILSPEILGDREVFTDTELAEAQRNVDGFKISKSVNKPVRSDIQPVAVLQKPVETKKPLKKFYDSPDTQAVSDALKLLRSITTYWDNLRLEVSPVVVERYKQIAQSTVSFLYSLIDDPDFNNWLTGNRFPNDRRILNLKNELDKLRRKNTLTPPDLAQLSVVLNDFDALFTQMGP